MRKKPKTYLLYSPQDYRVCKQKNNKFRINLQNQVFALA